MNSIFLVPAVGGLLLPIFITSKSEATQRRIYWLGFGTSIVSAFFIGFPPNWRTGLGLTLLVLVVTLPRAYFATPYIKIGDKVFAYRSDPETGSYGGPATASKSWWLATAAMIFCVGVVSIHFVGGPDVRPWVAVMTAAVIPVLAIGRGYQDARGHHPVARGQRVQLTICTAVTLGCFGVGYFMGFAVGKRRSPDIARTQR